MTTPTTDLPVTDHGWMPSPAIVEQTLTRLADVLGYDSLDDMGKAIDLAQERAVVSAVLEAFGQLCSGGPEWGYELAYPDEERRRRWVGSDPADLEIAQHVAASPANWREPGQPGEVLTRDRLSFVGPTTNMRGEPR